MAKKDRGHRETKKPKKDKAKKGLSKAADRSSTQSAAVPLHREAKP